LETSGGYKKFALILKNTENEANFLKAFEMAEDRASGKALQRSEYENLNDSNRPSTETLIETIRALRDEISTLRKGVGLETAK
jgi:hypothetical protein